MLRLMCTCTLMTFLGIGAAGTSARMDDCTPAGCTIGGSGSNSNSDPCVSVTTGCNTDSGSCTYNSNTDSCDKEKCGLDWIVLASLEDGCGGSLSLIYSSRTGSGSWNVQSTVMGDSIDAGGDEDIECGNGIKRELKYNGVTIWECWADCKNCAKSGGLGS